jgi:hypothetical protein
VGDPVAAEGIDRLFEVEPSEFVRARDELAARLKEEGRHDEAAEVKKLRKPPVVVFELNRLARRRPDDVAALIDAGEHVRLVQEQGAGALLREATRNVHALARGLAAITARPAEVEAALRAAALSGDATGELRAGRLTAVPEAPLGPDMWVAPADPQGDEPERPNRDLDEARARREKAKRDVDRARAHLEEAESRLAQAVECLEEAQREVERLELR